MSDNPLQQSVQFLPGGGPHRAELLAKLGVRTVEDLLWHLPRELLDLTDVRLPNQLVEGQLQTVRGVVVDMDARQLSGGRTMTAGLIDCGQDYVRGVWFNQPWMFQKLREGQNVLFSGKPKKQQGRWEFGHPRIQWLEPDDQQSHGGLLPKYPLTEGLTQPELRRLTREAVEQCAHLVPEHLPDALREQLQTPGIAAALQGLHVPRTREAYEAGRRRILLDDLLEFQLALALRRRAWRENPSAPRSRDREDRFPHSAAVPIPVHRRAGPGDPRNRRRSRLRPGDAPAAAGGSRGRQDGRRHLRPVDGGRSRLPGRPHGADRTARQSALGRHRRTAAGQPGRPATAHRQPDRGSASDALERIASGHAQLVIGTQAVIQQDVRFQKLALAVIDEQHRFGVAQRSAFATTASTPHVLVMTATPIPRSLCLTQFGDLDFTVIRDVPPGRKPVVTHRVHSREQQGKAWEFLRRQLKAGRQAYIVCPRVESESPQARDAAADKVYEYLQRTELRDFRLALVHGQVDRDERQRVMDRFREHEIDALVATTVVEVGVDVPNATLMVVLQAERFGLAQLHQLRGRVARGSYQGCCFLFSDADSEDAVTRLAALESMTDGFEIAQKDFELRGPGDVLGTRQHGELPLRVANVARDQKFLEEARTAAFDLVESGRLDAPDHMPLKLRVLERFGKLFDLPQSG